MNLLALFFRRPREEPLVIESPLEEPIVNDAQLEESIVNESPLGEPMTSDSIEARDQNPDGWLLDYWLNMYMIGIQVYGYDDSQLLSDKIFWEQNAMRVPEFLQRYSEFLAANRNEYRLKWQKVTPAERALEDGAYQAYVRDLKRMMPSHKTRRERLTQAQRDLEDRSYEALAQILEERENDAKARADILKGRENDLKATRY